MAKRKSINKRLSRYSRQSAGSAILDPDTNIFSDEYPYWWKNLENNTIARFSVDSNVFNQTSRYLDPNSQVGTSQVPDGWWKELQASNVSSSQETNIINNAEKDLSNSSSKSESGGEAKVEKRKRSFYSESQRAKKNALNDSVQTPTGQHAQKSRTSSINKATSGVKTVSSLEHLDKARENSLNRSRSASDVSRARPDVFKKLKKLNKKRDKNAFVDVLKGSNDELQTGGEHTDLATTERSMPGQTGPNQFALSFESENDLSHMPIPKAQSTILDGSTASLRSVNKIGSNSDIENEVLKPRSKLTIRRKRNTKKNLFENVFEEQGAADKAEKSDLAKESAAAVDGTSPDRKRGKEEEKSNRESLRILRRTLPTSETNDRLVQFARNEQETSNINSLATTIATSSDASDANAEVRPLVKMKSKFLKRWRRNSKKNLFQDIFEKSDSKLVGEDLVRKSIASVEDKSYRSAIDESDRTHSVHLSATLKEGNVSTVEKDTSGKRRGQQPTLLVNESQPNDTQNINDKSSKNVSISQKQSLLRSVRNASESEAVESVPRSRSRSIHDTKGQSISSALESSAEVKSPSRKKLDVSKNRHDRSSRSQNDSFSHAISESESKEVEHTLKSKNRRASGAQGQPDSAVLGSVERLGTRDTSGRKSDRSSSMGKRLSMRLVTESESENVEASPRRSSRRLSRARARSVVSPILGEMESTGDKFTPKMQSGRRSKTKKYSPLSNANDPESKEIEGTPKRRERNSGGVQEERSPVEEEIRHSVLQGESPRRSERLSVRRTYVSPQAINESKQKEIESTPQRNSRILEHQSASSPTEEAKSKRQSDRKSRSMNRSTPADTNPANANEYKGQARKRAGYPDKSRDRAVAFMEEQVEGVEPDSSPEKEKNLSQRMPEQSDEDSADEEILDFNKSRSRSTLSGMHKSHLEAGQSSPQRRKRSSRLLRPELDESAISEREAGEIGNSSARQSSRLSKLRAQEDVEVESSGAKGSLIAPEVEPILYSARKSTAKKTTRDSATRNESWNSLQRSRQENNAGKDLEIRRALDPSSSTNKERDDDDDGDQGDERIESAGQRLAGDPGFLSSRSNREEGTVLEDRGRATSKPATRTKSNVDGSKRQQSIKSFFKTDTVRPASQVFSSQENVEEIRRELERVKEWEMARMKKDEHASETKALPAKLTMKGSRGKSAKALQAQRPPTQVHKAFLVNGQVYKAPRLPRPQRWITDRLYNYLWKRMEPRYKLETRVVSEKFVQQLSSVTTLITKRKSYIHYKSELFALMKEMARLGIIRTRNDFYHFCHDFFPYELRARTVPMLLPGNKINIPYDADKLHEPLLDS